MMRRLAVLALLAVFAYSVYSLLSPSLAVGSGLGGLPLSSGMPVLLSPAEALSLRISGPLLGYLLALIYLILAALEWLAYQISRLLAHLLGVMPLLPPPNRTSPTGAPPTSAAPAIGGGGGGGAPLGAGPTLALNIPIAFALIAVLAVAALLIGMRRGQSAAEQVASAVAVGARPAEPPGPPAAVGPSIPARPPDVSADLPPPVGPRLVKWPLLDDVPPVWPLGRPLPVEPAAEGVSLEASGCAVAHSGRALVLSADGPCLARIVARRGGEEEALLVKFSDLHREVANSFHDAFKSAPGWMTAREIMAPLGAPPDVVEVFERAAYSDLPLDYWDFAKFYRWLRGHAGRV